MTKKKINIARAWWWTGGHVFPIKSLIEFLQTKQPEVSMVKNMIRFWWRKSLERETCAKLQKNIDTLSFVSILSGKWRREKTFLAFLKNIKDLFLLGIGTIQSLYYLKKYHIDVVFCKGGYVALPVVFAAKFLGKKLVVHESDVHPWLVNRTAAKRAKKIFTGFDGVFKNSETVWQILSDELLSTEDATKTTKEDSGETKVLVMGGSQWSKDLYDALYYILQITPELQLLFIPDCFREVKYGIMIKILWIL